MKIEKKRYDSWFTIIFFVCSLNLVNGQELIKFVTINKLPKSIQWESNDTFKLEVNDPVLKKLSIIRTPISSNNTSIDSVVNLVSISYLNDSILKNKTAITFNNYNINFDSIEYSKNILNKNQYIVIPKNYIMNTGVLLLILVLLWLGYKITRRFFEKEKTELNLNKEDLSTENIVANKEDLKTVLKKLLSDNNLGLLAYIKSEYKLEEIKRDTSKNTDTKSTSMDFNREAVLGTLTEQEVINILKSLLNQPQWLDFIMKEYGLQKIVPPPPPPPPSEVVVLITKYAGHPAHKSNEFVQPSDRVIPGMMLYELTIDEKNNKGTFKIIDNEPSHLLAIREYDTRILPACNYKGDPRNSTRIITIKPGTIKKSSGGWEIVNKSDIEFQ